METDRKGRNRRRVGWRYLGMIDQVGLLRVRRFVIVTAGLNRRLLRGLERSDPQAGRRGPDLKSAVPDRDDEFGIADDQAGEVHSVGAAECVSSLSVRMM